MESGRTHRDTLAFALTIVGATAWSLFPVGTLLRAHTDDRVGTLLMVTTVGAFLGAWSAATVWRRVALPTAAVAGALCAAFVVGVVHLDACRRLSVSVREVLMIGGVAVAAAGGASLGRMTRTPRTSLVAAWITISSMSLLALAAGIVAALGYDVDDDVGGLIVLLGGLPGAFAAMILCEHYDRRPTAWTLVILGVSAFMIVELAMNDDGQERDGALAGAFIGVVLAGHAAIANVVVLEVSDRWKRAKVPSAKVVDRR